MNPLVRLLVVLRPPHRAAALHLLGNELHSLGALSSIEGWFISVNVNYVEVLGGKRYSLKKNLRDQI